MAQSKAQRGGPGRAPSSSRAYYESLMRSDLVLTRKVIGEGSYGKVIEIKNTKSGELFVAKEFYLSCSIQYHHDGAQFMENYSRIAKLQHHNIVKFYGFFKQTSSMQLAALVTEKMERSLTSLLESDSDIPMAHKIVILLGVAEGLNYLHSLTEGPIVHGGLSSNNVLLNQKKKFEVKISDVGIATVMRKPMVTGSLLSGTNDFLPPNTQLSTQKGQQKYLPSLDIFSYGAVVLHTVTQKWPKPFKRSSLIEKINEETDDLKILVKCCMDDNHHNRPETIKVLETIKKLHEHIKNTDEKMDTDNHDQKPKYNTTVEESELLQLTEENKPLKIDSAEKENRISKLEEENKILIKAALEVS